MSATVRATNVAALASAADDFGTDGNAAERYSEALDSWLALDLAALLLSRLDVYLLDGGES